jgi:crotonobetainyl-CoA:carnitine CoA-transferase CaiB-like acyl-CoA transferase
MTQRPLSHIRILDFGQYLAGPLVGMVLADMGAEVIRIDPPGGACTLTNRVPGGPYLTSR